MASQSVSGYHAHLEFRTEKKGNETMGSCCVFWYLLLESFVCHWNKRLMNASSREFEIDIKEKENGAFG